MTAPATTGVLIYDATVTTSTSDLNGANNHLAINTTVFDSAPLPALTGAQKNSQYVLTWPGTATNLVLVCTPSILSGGWTNVPVAPVYTNGVTTVTLPLGSASQFYRLKRVP
jgi:hypothetical protein